MRLKKIKNKNFCSFEDAELELLQNSSDKNAIYLIHGINKDITDDFCKKVFKDNPLGQTKEQTPLCIVRKS
jgi:hypothetical protein